MAPGHPQPAIPLTPPSNGYSLLFTHRACNEQQPNRSKLQGALARPGEAKRQDGATPGTPVVSGTPGACQWCRRLANRGGHWPPQEQTTAPPAQLFAVTYSKQIGVLMGAFGRQWRERGRFVVENGGG